MYSWMLKNIEPFVLIAAFVLAVLGGFWIGAGVHDAPSMWSIR